jgi:hypothetical protein
LTDLLEWCLDKALSEELDGLSGILSVADIASLDVDLTVYLVSRYARV